MELPLLSDIQARISACSRCPRLVEWRERMATQKRAAYQEETYWGRPVPGFGDPAARLLICGLAPAAHGGNRTGRIFTGDRSGDWLYAALHRAGLANQPTSKHRDDGLQLTDCYVTACVHCAPPANKPTIDERDNCLPFLGEELSALPNVSTIICLGHFAWTGVLTVMRSMGHHPPKSPQFRHGAQVIAGPYWLLGCFHPSQQNTFTGRLTASMLDTIFTRAKALARAA
jgi:uracil-DNA glycosylase